MREKNRVRYVYQQNAGGIEGASVEVDDEAREDAAFDAVIVEGGLRLRWSENCCSGVMEVGMML